MTLTPIYLRLLAVLAGLLGLAGALAWGFGGPTLLAANAPALFGEFDRRANLPYDTGPRQKLDVYTPWYPKNLPIIVFWHGGGWHFGDKSEFRFVGATLAKAGYIAVLPNYRLHPEVQYPLFMRDAANALAWVVSHAEEIGGDPKRVYVAGHSAGAHIAGLLAYDSQLLADHGMRADAVRGLIGLSGPYELRPNRDPYYAIFTTPYTEAHWQPVQHVQRGGPPALIIHGAADETVPLRHAQAMDAALATAEVPHTVRIYPGAGHEDTVAAFAVLARDPLPVLDEIRAFVQ